MRRGGRFGDVVWVSVAFFRFEFCDAEEFVEVVLIEPGFEVVFFGELA